MENKSEELLKQNRLLSNIAIMGKVTATDYKEGQGLVRVLVAIDKEKESEFYIPWIRRRGGNDWEWWAPEVDEQVLIISPDGDLDRAVIVGAMPYKAKENSVTPAEKGKRWVLEEGEDPPPDSEKNKKEVTGHVVQYEDKTTYNYDKKLHIFQGSFLEKKPIEYKIDATEDKENALFKIKETEIKFDSEKNKDNIDIKIKDINLKIDATKDSEKVTLDANKNVKLEINAKNGEEKVTLDVKDGKSKVEMDGKGNLTLTAAGGKMKMAIKDSGDVAIECVKLDITAGGNVSLEGKNITVKGTKIALNC